MNKKQQHFAHVVSNYEPAKPIQYYGRQNGEFSRLGSALNVWGHQPSFSAADGQQAYDEYKQDL